MIKTNQKLIGYLSQVKPISSVKKIKLSSYRHPCNDVEAHRLVKEEISSYGGSLL